MRGGAGESVLFFGAVWTRAPMRPKPNINAMPMPSEIVGLLRSKITFKWDDGHESVFPARDLRLMCRCAQCVEEWSGEPILRSDKVSSHIRAKEIRLVGQYGLSIDWSEMPCANIYNFRDLRDKCPCAVCKPEAP